MTSCHMNPLRACLSLHKGLKPKAVFDLCQDTQLTAGHILYDSSTYIHFTLYHDKDVQLCDHSAKAPAAQF